MEQPSDRAQEAPQPKQTDAERRLPHRAPPSVLGKPIPTNLERHLQERCIAHFRWPYGLSFPGSQPVSLDKRSLQELRKNKQNYLVSEKADGTRYLLYVLRDGCYLIDRSFKIRKVDLHFPFPLQKANAQTPPVLDETLVDGELVNDCKGDGYVLRFLVYDIVAFMGNNVMDRSLTDRLKVIQNDVVGPRTSDKTHDYSQEPFEVHLKNFWKIKYIPYLFDVLIPGLPHENDGIVFTPIPKPYLSGTCKHLLKWKPNSMNSVDFELKVEWRNRVRGYSLLAADRLAKQFYAWITFPPDVKEMFDADKKANGKIIECVWDPNIQTFNPAPKADTWEEGEWQQGGWKYLRVREDKNMPNDVSVIERILKSRADNIKKEELFALAQEGASAESGPSHEGQHQHQQRQAHTPHHHRPLSQKNALQVTTAQASGQAGASSPTTSVRATHGGGDDTRRGEEEEADKAGEGEEREEADKESSGPPEDRPRKRRRPEAALGDATATSTAADQGRPNALEKESEPAAGPSKKQKIEFLLSSASDETQDPQWFFPS